MTVNCARPQHRLKTRFRKLRRRLGIKTICVKSAPCPKFRNSWKRNDLARESQENPTSRTSATGCTNESCLSTTWSVMTWTAFRRRTPANLFCCKIWIPDSPLQPGVLPQQILSATLLCPFVLRHGHVFPVLLYPVLVGRFSGCIAIFSGWKRISGECACAQWTTRCCICEPWVSWKIQTGYHG